MKYALHLLGLFMLIGFTSCEKDSCERTWTQTLRVPVTLNRAAVQDSIEAMPARELCAGGTIYAYGNYLFINVPREGYHLLDNSNPADPQTVSFLQVPGATHMAFVDGAMVSDSYADLVVLDLNGPNDLQLVSSTPNFLLDVQGFNVPDTEVAIAFEEEEVTFTESCDGGITGRWGNCENCDPNFALFDIASINSGGSVSVVNTGGSLARMAFCDDKLYVLGSDRLTTYQLDEGELQSLSNASLVNGQEAIIRRGEFLYAASTTALSIFQIENCGPAEFIGQAPHRWANDPVAVEGDRAVITTRTGDPSTGVYSGEMQVFDITDRTSPQRLATFPLSFPIGVTLHDGTLYICDGVDGLLVYDFAGGPAANLDTRRIQQFADQQAVDVAVLPYDQQTVVLSIGDEHLAQYARQADGTLEELMNRQVSSCIQP